MCEYSPFFLFSSANKRLYETGEAKTAAEISTKHKNDGIETQTNNRWSNEWALCRPVQIWIFCLFINRVSDTGRKRKRETFGRHIYYWFPYRITPDATAVFYSRHANYVVWLCGLCMPIFLIYIRCDFMLISVDSTNHSITTMTMMYAGF